MARMLTVVLAGILFMQTAFPAAARAQAPQRTDVPVARSRFTLPNNVPAPAASKPARKSATPGQKLVRSMLIGAAVGAGLALSIGTAGDCGACAADTAKSVLSGATYGALIGAAIRIHSSRPPSISIHAR